MLNLREVMGCVAYIDKNIIIAYYTLIKYKICI